MLSQSGFDVRKAPKESIYGLNQCVFGLQVEKTGEVDQREKQISYFFSQTVPISGRCGRPELVQLLLNLIPHVFHMGHIEAYIRGPFGDPLRAGERGHRPGKVSERGGGP